MSYRRPALLERVRSRVAGRAALLVAPVVVFELVVFVGALLYLVRLSLARSTPNAAFEAGTWTLANYASVLTDEFLLERLAFSLRLGVVVTALTLLLGFVYAYAAWRATGPTRAVLLGAILVELLVSIVIKVYAWVPLLAPEGTVNDVAMGLGLIEEPLRLVGTEVGVVVGLVYSMLPYVVLAVYTTLTALDWSVVESARDLGASRPRSVLEIVVPQATPGLLAGGITAFAWSTVAFAAPTILGSPAERTVASEASRFVTVTYDWPRAATVGVVAMVVVVVVTALVVGLVARFGPEDATEGLL